MSVFALEFGPGKIPWIYTVVNGQQRLMISAIIRIINFVFFRVHAVFHISGSTRGPGFFVNGRVF